MVTPIVVNGMTYIPILYFTDVLKGSIRFGSLNDGKLIVRAFSKNIFENNFDKLIKDFNFPSSDEAVARVYTEAVKTGVSGDRIKKIVNITTAKNDAC